MLLSCCAECEETRAWLAPLRQRRHVRIRKARGEGLNLLLALPKKLWHENTVYRIPGIYGGSQ